MSSDFWMQNDLSYRFTNEELYAFRDRAKVLMDRKDELHRRHQEVKARAHPLQTVQELERDIAALKAIRVDYDEHIKFVDALTEELGIEIGGLKNEDYKGMFTEDFATNDALFDGNRRLNLVLSQIKEGG